MSKKHPWIGGLAEWRDEASSTAFLSIAFTWRLNEAYERAAFLKAEGYRVVAGGPALFLVKMKHRISDLAEVGDAYPEAVTHHNPFATFASRGCPVGCAFCIVPAMEGREFTLLPDFVPRPILCDNNLSALPEDYQQHIIDRYQAAGVKMRDAQSGFEPATFTAKTYRRWAPLVNAGGGPWRFAYDESAERKEALAVMKLLASEPRRRKRVYVLIGNEPVDACMRRIQEVIDHGCEPHVQPYIKLSALVKRPHARFDWTEQRLKSVANWANRRYWLIVPYAEFDPRRRQYKPPAAGQIPLLQVEA